METYILTPLPITEIDTRFSSVNIAVCKVQLIRTNFSSKLQNNVTAICNVIVSWKKYKPRKSNNPTQCLNCLMYAHLGGHCNRLPACMIRLPDQE